MTPEQVAARLSGAGGLAAILISDDGTGISFEMIDLAPRTLKQDLLLADILAEAARVLRLEIAARLEAKDQEPVP